MINPNATHKRNGIVTALKRHAYKGDIDLEVTLNDGTKLNNLGFLYHQTLKLGDHVLVMIGFSIMSDSYGIRDVRRKNAKQVIKDAEFKRNLDSITYENVLEFRRTKGN